MITVTVVAPYPEASILRIAKYAESVGALESFYTPSRRYLRALARIVDPISRNVARRLERGIGNLTRSAEMSPLLELGRLFASSTKNYRVLSTYNSWLKCKFDDVISRRAITSDVVIAMPEAALNIFQQNPNCLKVLNCVDAHPEVHNLALLDAYPNGEGNSELVSDKVRDRVSSEMLLADVLLVPSNLVADQLIEQGISRGKIRVHPYGVDFSKFYSSDPEPTCPIRERPRLIYVGQISYRKGIPFLLEAVRGLDVDLCLIGPVPQKTLVEKLPSNVRYLGTFPHEELTRELADADCFVFPSLEDTFALTVLEAAATGLPVIVTNTTGAAEVLDRSATRLVDPKNVAQLRKACADVNVLMSSDRLENARKVSRVTRELNMTWDHYASSIIEELRLMNEQVKLDKRERDDS